MGPLEVEHNERLRDLNKQFYGKTVTLDKSTRIHLEDHQSEIRRIWAYLDTLAAKPDPDPSEALKVAVEALRTTAINRLPFTEERNTYDDGFTNGLLYALARLRELGVTE